MNFATCIIVMLLASIMTEVMCKKQSGSPGRKGPKGNRGRQGMKGKGVKGPPGPNGPRGPTGTCTYPTSERVVLPCGRQNINTHILHEKTWLFAGSYYNPPIFFLDDSGALTGFNKELVEGVCAVASRKCAVTGQEFVECGFSDPDGNFIGGRGLSSGWFDACAWYAITTARKNALDFTVPYLKPHPTSYYLLPAGSFNPDDATGTTIGTINGWFTDPHCLRQRINTASTDLRVFNNDEVPDVLNSGQADVIFAPRGMFDGQGLTRIDIPDVCDDGFANLVKKDSTLAEWWDPALLCFMESGEYTKLCDKYNVEQCLDIDL